MNENKYPFLMLLPKPLDKAQSAALETTKNTVIAAGAGSGKTQVLASRFAWLVLTGKAKADEILTLTFTNKAAAEMYQRIYETLEMYANHPVCAELTETEQNRAKQALSDFANAHIQTLDSYCSGIVRQCSNRYGIRPDFSTGSSDGIREVKDKALIYTLKNADAKGIKNFADAGKLQNFAEDKLAKAINSFTNLTTLEGFFCSKIDAQKQIICQALNFYCQRKAEENSSYPGGKNLAKIQENIYAEININFDSGKNKVHKANIDYAFEAINDSVIGLCFLTDEVFDTGSQKINDCIANLLEFKNRILSFSGIRSGLIKNVGPLITEIKNIYIPVLDSIINYIRQYDSIVSLFETFDDFLSEVNTNKRISGNLSFSDVNELALKILIENQDIREQEINAYKKIMIDEFQDNNSKNRDLLYLLSLKTGTQIDPNQELYSQIIQKNSEGMVVSDLRDPEKLFFVGDEKQSIYKFRGADVSVFNELTEGGENLLIPMTYNYRSNDETVQAFNQIFKNNGGIFGNPEDKIDYEAYYNQNALKKDISLPEISAHNVPIHFRFINTDKIKKENDAIENSQNKLISADEQIACDIAKLIFELGNEKKNWNDFAVLDKNRNSRNAITKYLSLYNIPYELDQFSNIFEDGIVNDFYNFLRLCVYPSDINAYAAYLTSPLSGLSENSVELILSHLVDISNYNFVFDPFLEKDEEIQNDLESSEFEKYLYARNFLQENKTVVLQQKLTTTLNLLWNQTGYKYETMLTIQGELCSEQFDMLFELARTSEENNKSVSWFIDELENLKKQSFSTDSDIDVSEISYPYERKPSVKIMTIHKSKGLQFEHVFICGCTEVSPKSENAALFFEEDSGLSVTPEKGTPNYFCLRLKELAKKKELAEFRRLIYVGITRAIKDIYIMGKWNPESKTNQESDFRIFERLILKYYQTFDNAEVLFTPGASFDFQNITPVSYSQTSDLQSDTNTDDLKSKRISELEDTYKSVQELIYKTNPIPRSCPSALEKSSENENSEGTDSEDFQKDNLRLQTVHEEALETSNFTPADFGTLVHAYLEAQALGILPKDFQAPVKFFKNLNEKETFEMKQKCIEYCSLFSETQAGKSLENAQNKGLFYRAEWTFKMFWDNTIYTGAIDLIYENDDGTYTIIDYKSDNTIDSSKYKGQQNCYRTAASKMLKVSENKIECKLWFMKENKFISPEPDVRQ